MTIRVSARVRGIPVVQLLHLEHTCSYEAKLACLISQTQSCYGREFPQLINADNDMCDVLC